MKIKVFKETLTAAMSKQLDEKRKLKERTSAGFVDEMTHLISLADMLLSQDEMRYGEDLTESEYNGLQITLSKNYAILKKPFTDEPAVYTEGRKNAIVAAKIECRSIYKQMLDKEYGIDDGQREAMYKFKHFCDDCPKNYDFTCSGADAKKCEEQKSKLLEGYSKTVE